MAESVQSSVGEIAIYLDNLEQSAMPAASPVDGQTVEAGASSEGSDPECDAFWVEMSRNQVRRLLQKSVQRGTLKRVEDSDPLRTEIRAAIRKRIVEAFRASYASRKHTFTWSILIFVFATIVLIPFLGFLGGPIFFIFVSSLWTVLHLVRRV